VTEDKGQAAICRLNEKALVTRDSKHFKIKK